MTHPLPVSGTKLATPACQLLPRLPAPPLMRGMPSCEPAIFRMRGPLPYAVAITPYHHLHKTSLIP
eukprot:213452-Chlamydomonas_euryale.AAC.5